MKKIIIPLVIALAVVVGVLYFSKIANAPDAQVDVLSFFSTWDTYDGKSTMGFTLKHPSEWTVDDSYPDVASFMPVDGENGFGGARFKATDKKQTLTKWLQAQDKERAEAMGGQYDDQIVSTKKVKVAKLPAIQRVEYADAAGFYFIRTFVKSGNYFYIFALHIGVSGEYTKEDEKVYNKILSTIKFTK